MGLRGSLALALVALAAGACGSASPAGPAPVPTRFAVARSSRSHVVVLVMENKEVGSVIGSPDAPFTTALARRYALASSYAITHPSLPNYLALTGGSTFGIDSDCTDCHVAATNVADQLETRGESWRAYMEGLPRPCFDGAAAGAYAKKHDPFVYYDDIARDPRRCRQIVPDRQLASDLARDRLPSFAWLSPGLCNDTHDCPVATGDRYLRRVVPALLRALGPHGFLILTWDEGESDAGCCARLASGGRIATIVAGPDVRRGARLRGSYDHYSVLRTIEEAFGVSPLRNAGAPSTRALDAAFLRPPRLR